MHIDSILFSKGGIINVKYDFFTGIINFNFKCRCRVLIVIIIIIIIIVIIAITDTIIMAIIITFSWFLVTSLSSVTKWREEIFSDLSRNPHRGHLIKIVGTFFWLSFFLEAPRIKFDAIWIALSEEIYKRTCQGCPGRFCPCPPGSLGGGLARYRSRWMEVEKYNMAPGWKRWPQAARRG